jgi:hypothetical protein
VAFHICFGAGSVSFDLVPEYDERPSEIAPAALGEKMAQTMAVLPESQHGGFGYVMARLYLIRLGLV